ncbi:heme exporter protein CcmD [Comamonas sp. NoAH]|nr:heme exporter protein CcmD [Comamonas sp. NoAH]
MQSHAFYIALAYGVSALLLLAEAISLWLRWRKAQQVQQEDAL